MPAPRSGAGMSGGQFRKPSKRHLVLLHDVQLLELSERHASREVGLVDQDAVVK